MLSEKTVKFQLIFKNLTPILIKDREYTTNFTSTLNFIPGSTMFGAFIQKIIEEKIDEDILTARTWKKIIKEGYNGLSDKTQIQEYLKFADIGQEAYENFRFSDFLIVPSAKKTLKPIPPLMSLMKCRINSSHFFDSTIFFLKKWLFQKEPITNESNNFMEYYTLPQCSKENCRSPLKKGRFDLFYDISDPKNAYKGISPVVCQKLSIALNHTTKSIDRVNGKGALYSQEFIKENQFFSGTIELPLEDSVLIKDVEREIAVYTQELRIGARKTAGFGHIKLVAINQIQPGFLLDRYVKNYEKIQYHFNGAKRTYIPFYLFSHFPIKSLPKFKKALSSFGKVDIHLLFSSSKPSCVQIRNAALKKWISINVIDRGTVGFIKISNHISDKNLSKLFQILQSLEFNRIGNLSHKGFGEIRFLPDIFFHKAIST